MDVCQDVTAYSRVQKSLSKVLEGEGTKLGHCVNPILYYDEKQSKPSALYEPLLRNLQVLKMENVFCVGGRIQMSEYDQHVQLVVHYVNSYKPTPLGYLHALPVDEKWLEEHGEPSPFGDLRLEQTVIDEKVRMAAEISQFALQFDEVHEQRADATATEEPPVKREKRIGPERLLFLDVIHQQVERHFDRRVQFCQHKLNIYSQGGFFKPHVDTPTHPAMIGSVVVCLPSVHTGGELVVQSDGDTQIFDFSEHSGDPAMVQWAAFYSDCRHEVQEVTTGRRITLTYDVYAKDYWDGDRRDEEEWNDDDEISNGIRRPDFIVKEAGDYAHISVPLCIKQEVDVARSGSKDGIDTALVKILTVSAMPTILEVHPVVGIFLSQRYSLGNTESEVLKGVDKALYESIKERFPRSRLITVVDVYNLRYYDERTSGTKRVVAFARNDLLRLGGTTEESESAELTKLDGAVSGKIPFIRQWMQSGASLYESKTGYIEYTGNESQPGCIESIYFHCALLVVK